MTTRKHNPRNEAPISLHPLSLGEALGKAMNVQPPFPDYDLWIRYLAHTRINARDRTPAKNVANYLWKAVLGNNQWFSLPEVERDRRVTTSGSRIWKTYMQERQRVSQTTRGAAKNAIDAELGYIRGQV